MEPQKFPFMVAVISLLGSRTFRFALIGLTADCSVVAGVLLGEDPGGIISNELASLRGVCFGRLNWNSSSSGAGSDMNPSSSGMNFRFDPDVVVCVGSLLGVDSPRVVSSDIEIVDANFFFFLRVSSVGGR